MSATVLTFAVLVVAFSAFAQQLGRWNITAPIVFVVAGALIGVLGDPPPATAVLWLTTVAKAALALVLFHDAAQVRPRDIVADYGLDARLLLVGFPLTILGGYVLARLLFGGQPAMLSLLVAVSLAPTDAGLGAATVLNPAVPVRVRRMLNVESGMNDGMATPVALFAIAALAGAEGLRPAVSLVHAVVEILVGLLAGAAVGIVGATVLGWSRDRGWSTAETRALAVVALPFIAFGGTEALHGNGYVAAFAAGTALASAGRWLAEEHGALHLTEVLTGPLGFAV